MTERNSCNFQIALETGVFNKKINYLCRLKIKVISGYSSYEDSGSCDGKDCIFMKLLDKKEE